MTLKAHAERRVIVPCTIFTCLIIYSVVFLSYIVLYSSRPMSTVQPPSHDARRVHAQAPRRLSCNILVAHGGDDGAGFATLIYAYPINFVLYALKYNYSFASDPHDSVASEIQ